MQGDSPRSLRSFWKYQMEKGAGEEGVNTIEKYEKKMTRPTSTPSSALSYPLDRFRLITPSFLPYRHAAQWNSILGPSSFQNFFHTPPPILVLNECGIQCRNPKHHPQKILISPTPKNKMYSFFFGLVE